MGVLWALVRDQRGTRIAQKHTLLHMSLTHCVHIWPPAHNSLLPSCLAERQTGVQIKASLTRSTVLRRRG
jgi:hypothetical protein